MSIKFRCPDCGHGIKAPDAAAGKGVRCPNCSKKVRIPDSSEKSSSSSRRKKKDEPTSQDSNAFLENIDLGKAEAAGVVLCQKCAAEIPPEETTCPECGFDPEQLTTAGRRRQKMAAKGIDPNAYYANLWKDPFAFTKSNFKQVMKTGWILAFYFILSCFCFYWLTWVATGPPFGFWTLLTTVATMVPLGWLLVQHLEIVQISMEKKDTIKKIRFDFALCGMSGIKFLFWIFIYGLPFWIVFGGLGILLDSMGIAIGPAIGISLALISILIFTPQAMSHLAMPVESQGWIFPKVAKTLRLTFMPGLMWALLFLVVNLPVIGGIAGVYFVGGQKFEQFMDVHLEHAQVHRAKVEIKLAESSGMEARIAAAQDKWGDIAQKDDVAAENYSALILPIVAGILCCFLLGFSSVVAARANGLFTANLRKGLNLIGSKKELTYVKKEEGNDKIRNRKTTVVAPIGARSIAYVIDVLALAALNGTVLGMIYYVATSFDADFESLTAYIISLCVASIGPTIAFAFYFIKNESGYEQTTPGKGAMKLFVAEDERCQPITTGQAVIRFLSFWFLSCVLTAGIGNLIAIFRPDRKTLHDLISGTQVRMDTPKAKEEAVKE